jgi:glycosyltransferase involved in cell wall biosynthesis
MLTADTVVPSPLEAGHPDNRPAKRLRIAFLSARDPRDRRSWSGTLFSMAQALEKHCGDVFRIGPLQPFSLRVGKAIYKSARILTNSTYLYTHTTSLSKKVGGMAGKRLAEIECDVVFAPAGSVVLAHLETRVPIVYLSDATFHLMVDYYADFTRVFRSHLRMADELERESIQKASQLVYPSMWAAQSAMKDYGADPSRVNVVPFGANMENPPTREDALRRSKQDVCRLLFVGVEWGRKGGDIAVETLVELERLGLKAELTIVGCQPDKALKHPNVKFIPFLSKNDPQDRMRLDGLYKNSDFFLLPTRAECFSIALCEANAYGLPVLSTETGGLRELVHNGVNGFLFPLAARGDQYAARIRDTFNKAADYQSLRASSRDQFETRLNWDAWGKRMNTILWNAASSRDSQQASDKGHPIHV